jgi:uncharacterized protein YqeY
MLKAFERKFRTAHIRCSINVLLRFVGVVLTGAGLLAVLAVLIMRLFAFGQSGSPDFDELSRGVGAGLIEVMDRRLLWGFWGAVGVTILLLWLLRRPSRMQVSLLLDERLQLRERFSTTLALAKSEDPFAVAACAEARAKAERICVERHFPIRPTRCWLYAGSVWVLAFALVMFLPQKDLLGFLRKGQQQEQDTKQVQQAIADVNQATNSVKLAVERLDPELSEALDGLEKAPKDAKPQEIKREAIRKLGDLSEQIKKQMQGQMQLDTLSLMESMLKQLRGSSDVFSQQLRQALAQGKFSEASNLLNQMQQQLADGKVSDQQQKDLARQLQELGKQLQELAQKNDQLDKELEKLGLDKGLAKLSADQLRKALEKLGLDAQKIEELMQKAQACQGASGRCSGLGRALAACGLGGGGLSGDELAAIMDQLDGLESLKQQLMLAQATLDEISRCVGCLGQGMCQGLGGQGPFAEGQSDRSGAGTGGPGVGYGPRATDQDGQTGTQKTRVDNKSGQGPVIASWYFKGSQIKGDAQRDFGEVIQAARDNAAEAINENEIPRKYEDAVKRYFSQIEEAVPKK